MSKLEKYLRKDLPDEFYVTRLTLKELKEMILKNRTYYKDWKEYKCSSCQFEGEGFICYDEKLTKDNPDPVNELLECPECKHGTLII